jgi:small-conductance mechanosensitive channel
MTSQWGLRVVVPLLLMLLATTVFAQSPAPPAAEPSPIAIPDLVTEAEAVNRDLEAIDHSLTADSTVGTVNDGLAALSQTIDAEFDKTQRMLGSQPSLESLRETTARWDGFGRTLGNWQRILTARAAVLQAQLDELDGRQKSWDLTLEAARSAEVPPEIVERVDAVAAAIRTTRASVDERRGQALALQKRVGDQSARVNATLAAVKAKRDEVIGRLLVQDRPELWNLGADTLRQGEFREEMRGAFAAETRAFVDYARRHVLNFVVHFTAFLLLVWGLYWARGRMRRLADAEPHLDDRGRVYRLPVAMALVIAIFFSRPFYPQAPRLFVAILGALAIVPAVVILRATVNRRLRPILYAIAALYFVDRFGSIAESLPLASRLVGIASALGAIVFLAWYAASQKNTGDETETPDQFRKIARGAADMAAGAFTVALAANVLGYITLAHMIESAILGSAYTAVVLYVAVLIVEGLVVFALRVPPLSLLAAVRRHRRLFRQRIMKGVRWLAVFVWLVVRLEQLTVRDRVSGALASALHAELRVGVIAISAGDVLLFVLTIWGATLLARFVCFLLEEDVFIRVPVGRGIPYAVTTLARYVVVALGVLVALSAVGVDLTRLTILTGAFGVGLGLGLQGVVNNFVSGLVLLFERPVNVGDQVQIGQHSGSLQHIGLRSSVVRTMEGSEVIVPNGFLIANDVVNWTLSDQQRRLEIDVGVAYGTDPKRVIELLADVARDHPKVLDDPPPDALFMGFGENALRFQLRAWTREFARWANVRSDLAVGVNAALAAAGITIPLPQRDLRVQSVAPEALRALASGGSAHAAAERPSHRAAGRSDSR